MKLKMKPYEEEMVRIGQEVSKLYKTLRATRDRAFFAHYIATCMSRSAKIPEIEKFYKGEQVWFFDADQDLDHPEWIRDNELEIQTGIIDEWTTRHPEYDVFCRIRTEEGCQLFCDERSNNIFATEQECKEAMLKILKKLQEYYKKLPAKLEKETIDDIKEAHAKCACITGKINQLTD